VSISSWRNLFLLYRASLSLTFLAKLGIRAITNATVERVEAGVVYLGDG
jgi:hypothetical protein